VIEEGKPAPDFTVPNQDGEPVTLSALRGGWVVLYFYPKADTPGCTKQACGVRDRAADYEEAGMTVLGISPDSVADVRAFADKYGLGFTLLADEDASVARLYGVWTDHTERTTFLIDPDGEVARVFPRVRPDEHDDLLLGAFRELTART
jgi:thioredoxin-dependent peroxiredoxin